MSESGSARGDVVADYEALRRGAGLVSGRHELVWVEGSDAVSFLDGQLSQHVAAIPPGSVARSFLLEPRGKLRALLWVLAGEERVGLVADRGRGETVLEDLERFRFRVDVRLRLEEAGVAELWGPESAGVLEEAGLPAPEGWEAVDGLVVARLPLGELPRFAVVGEAGPMLEAAGAAPVGERAAEAVRIEGGEAVAGVDVDESTIPHESGLVEASVSFTKGCYLGQELVARIEARGHVNRRLRGIVVAGNVPPPPGAEIATGEGAVGTLTSVAESPTLGAPIGLALVRREVEPGASVMVRWAGGAAEAQVRELPLDDFAPS